MPGLRADGLRGGLLSWDGQLEDDARLVVALARTAAAYGARVLTRTRVTELSGDGAVVRDELTGGTATIRARAVVNAAGVWAGGLVPGVRLRPSRGTHLVLRAGRARRPDHRGDGAGARARRAASCSRCRSPTAGCTSGSPTSRSTATYPTYPSPPRPRSTSCSTVIGAGVRRGR